MYKKYAMLHQGGTEEQVCIDTGVPDDDHG